MSENDMRRFTSPLPGEDWEAIAARAFPGEGSDAVQKLKSWNLHLFTRIPPGKILGSDVLFLEPPLGA